MTAQLIDTENTTAPVEENHREPAWREGRRFLPMGLTGTVFGFLIASASLYGIAALMSAGLWRATRDYYAFGSTTRSDVIEAAAASDAVSGFAFMSFIVTVILFLVWFFLAYKAAVSRGAVGARRTGWTIGGWFIPIGNLFIPKQVMNEIDRMSQPGLTEPINLEWQGSKRFLPSDWWWGTWIAASFAGAFKTMASADLEAFALASTFGYVLTVASGVLLAVTVLEMGRRLRA